MQGVISILEIMLGQCWTGWGPPGSLEQVAAREFGFRQRLTFATKRDFPTFCRSGGWCEKL